MTYKKELLKLPDTGRRVVPQEDIGPGSDQRNFTLEPDDQVVFEDPDNPEGAPA